MKKLFNTKFKKIAWIIAIIMIILCLAFIRTVPNYGNKFGFEVVSLWDYNKYNQGYCLVENRILDKKELYERAVGEYLEKELEINKKIDEWRYKNYGSNWKSEIEIGYYKFRDDINLENWFEKIKNDYIELYANVKNIHYNSDFRKQSTNELLFNKLKIEKINPMKYIDINFNNFGNITAGFKIPILFVTRGIWGSDIMLDNCIILENQKLIGGYKFGFSYDFNNSPYNKETEKYILEESKLIKSNKSYPNVEIDNCGNINYYVKDEFVKRREAKGG